MRKRRLAIVRHGVVFAWGRLLYRLYDSGGAWASLDGTTLVPILVGSGVWGILWGGGAVMCPQPAAYNAVVATVCTA